MWLRASLLLLALAALVAAAPKIRDRTKRPRGYDTRYERTEPMAGPHTWISTNGNWGATSSWDTGAVPLATEVVYFDGLFSNHSVTSGLGQSAVTLERLWVRDNYTGNLGTPSEPLDIGVNRLQYFGSGTMYWDVASMLRCVIDSRNTVDAFHFAGGSPDVVYIRGGRVTFDPKCGDASRIHVTPSVVTPNEPSVFFSTPTAASTLGYVTQTAGFIENHWAQEAGEEWTLAGGEFVHQAGTTNPIRVVGGHLEYNSAGTASSIEASSGTVDFLQDRRAKTVSLLTVLPGANIKLHSQVTVTNHRDITVEVPDL